MPSRREPIQMSDTEMAAFLDEQRIVSVCTTGPKGRPHLMPLWYVVEQAPILRGWTFAKSQKAKNLDRDPRATLGVDDGVQYAELRGVMLECDVQIERDPEIVADYGLALFKRYAPDGDFGDEARAAVLKQAEKRIAMRFVPTRVVSWDHRKLGGEY